ncbi:hypothetical protein MBLNU230_g2550t1 [Neophaeotheca triangularis]
MASIAGTKRLAESGEPPGKRARLDVSACEALEEARTERDREAFAEEPLFQDGEDDDDDGSSPEADGEESRYDPLAPQKVRARNSKLTKPKRVEKKHWRPKIHHCDREGCKKSFRRPAQLTEHKRTHDNQRVHACPHPGCDKDFLRSEHMTRHYAQCHAEKTYICDYKLVKNGEEVECRAAFSTNQRLRRHRDAHDEKKKWVKISCPHSDCDRVFRKQETLDRHVKMDHLRDEKPYTCTYRLSSTGDEAGEQCRAAFKSANGLKRHVAFEHEGSRFLCHACVSKIGPEGPQEESLSTFSFKTFGELQAHLKEVHRPSCEICNKTFENDTVLKAHFDVEHTAIANRRVFPCPYQDCSSSFTRNSNLNVHIRNIHGPAKAWVCGEANLGKSKKIAGWDGKGCGHTVNAKVALEEHIRTKHMGLMGSQQARKIKKGEDTSIGLLTGTGSYAHRPHGCLLEDCQYRFTTVHLLEMHMEMTHGWTVDDVNEQMIERQAAIEQNQRTEIMAEDRAIEDDDFYIGGLDEFDHIRRQLESHLGSASFGSQAAQSTKKGSHGTHAGVVNDTGMLNATGTTVEDGQASPEFAIDPSLFTSGGT